MNFLLGETLQISCWWFTADLSYQLCIAEMNECHNPNISQWMKLALKIKQTNTVNTEETDRLLIKQPKWVFATLLFTQAETALSFLGLYLQRIAVYCFVWLTCFSWNLHEGLNSFLAIASLWGHCRHVVPSHWFHYIHHSLRLEGVGRYDTREEIVPAVIAQFWSGGGVADLWNLKPDEKTVVRFTVAAVGKLSWPNFYIRQLL